MAHKLANAKKLRENGSVIVGVGVSSEKQTEKPLPPVAAPKVVEADIKNSVGLVPSFKLIASLTFPTNSKNKNEAGKMVKFSYSTVSVGVVQCVWDKIGKYFAEDPAKLSGIRGLINSYTSTNNTCISGLVRAKAQFPAKEFHIDYTAELFQYVQEHLPVGAVDDVIDKPDFTNGDIFDIIPGADAGMPFMATNKTAKCGDVDVYEEALGLANKYIAMLSSPKALEPGVSGNFRDYMARHPLEFLFIMKRKFERMPRKDLNVKCRVYYVCPYALKLLYKWVSYYVRKQSLNFVDVQDTAVTSASAYKFCWSRGGADKIIRWCLKNRLKARESGRMIFQAICFGDDQMWTFTYPDGTVVIMCPDVVAMDMHVPSVIGKCELGRHIKTLVHTPSVLYQNVCKLLAEHAFHQTVLINGSICAEKKYGLISGVPLTTQLDIHGSVVMHQCVETQVKFENVGKTPVKPCSFTKESFAKFTERTVGVILKKTGFKLKPETLEYYVVDSTKDFGSFNLLLKFLGNVILFDQKLNHYYPAPAQLELAWVSLAIPSSPTPSKKVLDTLMARIYGLLLSGYCFSKDFSSMAYDFFDFIKMQGGLLNSCAEDIDATIIDVGEAQDFIIAHPKPLTPAQTKVFYALGPEGFDTLEGQNYLALYDENISSKVEVAPVVDFDILDPVLSNVDANTVLNFDISMLGPVHKAIDPSMVGKLQPKEKVLKIKRGNVMGLGTAGKQKRGNFSRHEEYEDDDPFDDEDVNLQESDLDEPDHEEKKTVTKSSDDEYYEKLARDFEESEEATARIVFHEDEEDVNSPEYLYGMGAADALYMSGRDG